MPTHHSAPDAGQADVPAASRGFGAELRDSLSLRAVLLVTGVLLLQLGFIGSYIHAFHSPTPSRIPIAVAAPAAVSQRAVTALNALDGRPLDARAADDAAAARQQVLDRTVDAALVVDPAGTTDTLMVASAGGPAVSQAVTTVAEKTEAAQQRRLKVVDIRPPAANDSRSLSSFYLVIGWMVGGYLAAAILGIAAGARPANLHRTTIRLGTLAVYAAVSGLGGALIADPWLDALPGHFAALWGIGALVVFASAAATMALQVLFGIAGIGAAIGLFVVLGNPSAGGPYPGPLLPSFWRAIGQLLPPGAGTTAVRNTMYFSGNATTGALLTLAAYAVAGILVSLAATGLRRAARRAPRAQAAARGARPGRLIPSP
ncbi:DUF3533 domain-containing protein [Streptomyces sp. SAI-090]|jgi:hypothetical protein|uniref:DUF3533 domain-containing protein n=1 Tax=Streptomyces sp. SAI-090 TaxID=2940545 RepID=UPI0024749359|nr:DUF3533 domain-containing protein [Streptomyces sp. SAI-090]MDH6522307.1 hypothetical protein [Streptomyces sp. SAI-090]